MASKQFNITFNNGKQTLTIGYGTEYGIISIEGFDGSNIDVEVEEYQFDGGKITRRRVGSRALSIHFDCDNLSPERKYFIQGFFNVHKPGTLTVNNQGHLRQIDYTVSTLEDKQDNMFKRMEFELQMQAPAGYFVDPDYSMVEMNTWIGGFTLPTKLPFKLRQRGIAQKVIENIGQADAPIWVQFRGPAASPRIVNVTSGLYVQVATELTAGQTLHVKTDEAKPEVLIEENGVFSNGYPLITHGSNLELCLLEGTNVLKYESGNPSQINAVNVLYKNRYVGA